MDKLLFREWLRHPVTKEFSNLLLEHKEAIEKSIIYGKIETDTIGLINQLKGQMLTLEMLGDLEMFLKEKVTREEEILDDVEEDT